jgi:hypothetical protein
MSKTKTSRTGKKQLGQFMTPTSLATKIVSEIDLTIDSIVLEPSFGDGSFIIAIIEKLISQGLTLEEILQRNLYGVELDPTLYQKTLDKIEEIWGELPRHNLQNSDFLITDLKPNFTHIIGNPPFGGTINPVHQQRLETLYGKRLGMKIKKETYSLFVIKSVETLVKGGELHFICSDTFLSIKTMSGLRNFLGNQGHSKIERLQKFSEETNWGMVVIHFQKSEPKDHILVEGKPISFNLINLTPNMSWSMEDKWSKYFLGPKLSDFIIASGGLSTGKNEWFIRDIKEDKITETFRFQFFMEPVTLKRELEKAKLNKLHQKKIDEIKRIEERGDTEENVRVIPVESYEVHLPNPDYSLYNKATPDIFYSKPKSAIYWKEGGKAVITFKKRGNWYLRGVGGANFFGKEAITWQLISSRIRARYLPSGYILDNSSPIAILKEGVERGELWFILGWLLTDLANGIQKEVINHTKNIQNGDIERLPYPHWVSPKTKLEIIKCVESTVKSKMSGEGIDERGVVEWLNEKFKY